MSKGQYSIFIFFSTHSDLLPFPPAMLYLFRNFYSDKTNAKLFSLYDVIKNNEILKNIYQRRVLHHGFIT